MLHLGPSDTPGLAKRPKHGDTSCFWGEHLNSLGSEASVKVMRSLAGRLEVVGGLDPFAQFDPKALTNEVTNTHCLCWRRWTIWKIRSLG